MDNAGPVNPVNHRPQNGIHPRPPVEPLATRSSSGRIIAPVHIPSSTTTKTNNFVSIAIDEHSEQNGAVPHHRKRSISENGVPPAKPDQPASQPNGFMKGLYAVGSGLSSVATFIPRKMGGAFVQGAIEKAGQQVPMLQPLITPTAHSTTSSSSSSQPSSAPAPAVPAPASSFSLAQLARMIQNPVHAMSGVGMGMLRTALGFLEGQVRSQGQESREITNRAETRREQTGQSGLSREEIEGHFSRMRNERGILDDLAECKRIADAALSTDADYSTAFSNISTIMQRHPIWLHSLWQIPIPGMGSSSEPSLDDAVGAIRQQLQALERNHHPEMDEHFNFAAGVETQAQKLCETGSFMGTYNTVISYFMGDPPTVNPEQYLSFQAIMAQIETHGTRDPEQRRELFLTKIREEISKRTDIFFLKRWGLQLILPLVLWGCEFASERFVTGAKDHLRGAITGARSPNTSQVSNTPVEMLTQVANGLTQGYINHAYNSAAYSRTECIEQYLGGPEFLRGHPDLHALCERFGAVAVDELMVPFSYLTTLCESTSTWLRDFSSSNYIIAEIFLSIFTVPLRIAIWTLKTVLASPVEWIANKIIKWTAKTVLQRTGLVENLTRMTRQALFPDSQTDFTEVIDTLILDLLKQLRTHMNAPADPNRTFERMPINEATNEAMEDCLNALFESLDVSRMSAHDLLRDREGRLDWRQQLSQSMGSYVSPKLIKGVVGILNKSYQIFMDEQMLNQQLYLTLKVSVESMLRQGTELTPQERELRANSHKERRNMIRHHIDLLLWDSVKLATDALANSVDPEAPINHHVQWLKQKFAPNQQQPLARTATLSDLHPSNQPASAPAPIERPRTPGFTVTWEQKLRSICDPATPNDQALVDINSIYNEFRDVYTHMTDELLKMEQERTVGPHSLKNHKKAIAPLWKQLGAFQENFIKVENHRLRHALPEDINTKLSTIVHHTSSLRHDLSLAVDGIEEGRDRGWLDGTKITDLKARLGEIDGLGQAILEQTRGILPGDLREFLVTLRAEVETYKTQVKALEKFAALTTLVVEKITDRQSELCVEPVVTQGRRFNLYLRQLQPFMTQLSPTDYHKVTQSLSTLERTLANHQNPQQALNTFIEELRSVYENAKQDIRRTLTTTDRGLDRNEKLAHKHIQRILKAKDPSQQNYLPEKLVKIQTSLRELFNCVDKLEEVSSIQARIIEENGAVGWLQHLLHGYLSNNVNDLVARYTREGATFEAFISRFYIHFLEDHGVRLQNNLSSSVGTNRRQNPSA